MAARQLPAGVPHFAGRAAELAALTGVLDQPGQAGPATVVISAIGGTAGVGKTALAVRWAHQVADRFPDGQLYVNLRGYDPDQPVPAADALAGFLRALGVPGQDIPAGAGERAARYRSLLAAGGCWCVLDNAGSAEQVRPLLPGTPGCMVVVTSRDALAGLVARDGARRLDLGLLPLADAVGLLRALIGGAGRRRPGRGRGAGRAVRAAAAGAAGGRRAGRRPAPASRWPSWSASWRTGSGGWTCWTPAATRDRGAGGVLLVLPAPGRARGPGVPAARACTPAPTWTATPPPRSPAPTRRQAARLLDGWPART